ncbi:MAG: hypothetical protein IPG95_05390 [Saprospiraceae bacterium]|nr:hypothetical protein [Saprospiraceae bacterium]
MGNYAKAEPLYLENKAICEKPSARSIQTMQGA